MKQRIICKTLAVAVILLLVGLGVQPAISYDVSNNKKENNNVEDIFIPDIYVKPLLPEYGEFYAAVFTRLGIYDGILNVTATVMRLPSMTIEKTKNWSSHIKLVPYTEDYPKIYKFKVGKLAPGFFLVKFEIFPEEEERFEFNNKCHRIYFINIIGINVRILFSALIEFFVMIFSYPWGPP